MNTSTAAQLLLRRVAAELDTDLDHLDPKDVMRYDRDVYDACYLSEHWSAPSASDDFTPSVGACITSMAHILDVTQGVLNDILRAHLRGVLQYLVAAETAETQAHREAV